MDKAVAEKIFAIQDTAQRDEAYRQLLAEHEVQNQRFLQALESMPQPQREAVEDYLGLVAQMHLRLLELACGPS